MQASFALGIRLHPTFKEKWESTSYRIPVPHPFLFIPRLFKTPKLKLALNSMNLATEAGKEMNFSLIANGDFKQNE